MPFFLDRNPTPGEVSEAINYLLGNAQQTTSTNIGTGQVTDAVGNVVSYLYKYLQIKYADSFDGTLNFSNTPTSRLYYGIRNVDSSVESTNPDDYIWYKVTGGFGTTKQLFYSVTGGRRIDLIVSLAAPSPLYQADSGSAIDLDVISGSDGASSRICYAKSTSTSLASTPATYQTSGSSSFPPTNTWGGSETWQATPPSLAVNEALFQSDGIYNPMTNLTTWNVPYLSNLKVGALSAISANLGTVTAGELVISGSGGTPTISGSTMTGSGTHLYSDGRFALGTSTGNIVYNGSAVSLNGFATALTSYNSGVSVPSTGTVNIFSFTIAKAGNVLINLNTYLSAAFPTTCAGAFLYISLFVKNGAGTIFGTQGSLILAGAPVVTQTLPTFKLIGTTAGWNTVINLPADTYTIYASRSSQTDAFDSAGNSVAINYIQLQNANGTAYQVLA